ncbi:hypothetical protein Clacol_000287 [Clathrus columnatus]|uniref:Cytochrome P450 n=1 Tax=Clathrus columnatus TaxID=1419009 RepID=A0AAV4ZYX9_9AGAM|nr:hypothetical protein Clacol_000287 [Clathrus columnatus]
MPYYLQVLFNVPKGLKLPPGPPRRFLVGNLKDLPRHKEWETYDQWRKNFGDLVYLNIFGKSLLFLNSPKLVSEVFDTRGAIYSERFQSTMLSDLGGFNWSLALMQPNEIWRQHRSILQKHLSKISMVQHQVTLGKCSKTLLALLYREPLGFLKHTRHLIGAMVLESTYGLSIKTENDPYIEVGEKALELFADISTPGAYLVDIFPFMKYVPAWFPGAAFKQKASELNFYFTTMKNTPFAAVKAALKAGNASPSFVSNLLEIENFEKDSFSQNRETGEELIKSISGVIYLAGIDTVEATIQVFFIAMILYPDVQKAAQEELEKVVGLNSLPTFKDRPNLPYINALCKEVLRWHPITPAGFPHMLKQDDVIGKYFVPKGTLVMGNTWSLLHSEEVYGSDVHVFNPARFLKEGIKDPDIAFGYGRRSVELITGADEAIPMSYHSENACSHSSSGAINQLRSLKTGVLIFNVKAAQYLDVKDYDNHKHLFVH